MIARIKVLGMRAANVGTLRVAARGIVSYLQGGDNNTPSAGEKGPPGAGGTVATGPERGGPRGAVGYYMAGGSGHSQGRARGRRRGRAGLGRAGLRGRVGGGADWPPRPIGRSPAGGDGGVGSQDADAGGGSGRGSPRRPRRAAQSGRGGLPDRARTQISAAPGRAPTADRFRGTVGSRSGRCRAWPDG